MKKIVALSLLLTCVSLSAQTIAFRQEEGDAVTVSTNYLTTTSVFKKDTGTSLTIVSSKSSEEKRVLLGLFFQTGYNPICTQEGSKAILKTFSGKIITLYQWDSTSDSISNRLCQKVGKSSDLYGYTLRVHYLISMEDALTLMNDGVAFLRIEASDGLKDYSFDKDYLGGFILKEYLLIQNKQSFESDF